MEKLAVLSHVLYNKELLDKTSTLQLYTIKKIKMSQSYYDKDSELCISELKKRTFNYIIYSERLYYDLIDVDDRIHLVFTDDYYNELVKCFKSFITDIQYAVLVDKITDIMFTCIRSASISIANVWGCSYNSDSFYNIIETELFRIIDIQFSYITQKYFTLT